MDLIEQLRRDEGLRLKAYRDQVGKLTIGFGRNLDDVGISKDEAEYLLANDIARTRIELTRILPWITNLNDARQGVLFNMAFNMGIPGLLNFKNTLACVKSGEFKEAATHMKNSLWARQVTDRAFRLCDQMETGIWR